MGLISLHLQVCQELRLKIANRIDVPENQIRFPQNRTTELVPPKLLNDMLLLFICSSIINFCVSVLAMKT